MINTLYLLNDIHPHTHCCFILHYECPPANLWCSACGVLWITTVNQPSQILTTFQCVQCTHINYIIDVQPTCLCTGITHLKLETDTSIHWHDYYCAISYLTEHNVYQFTILGSISPSPSICFSSITNSLPLSSKCHHLAASYLKKWQYQRTKIFHQSNSTDPRSLLRGGKFLRKSWRRNAGSK